MVQIYNWQQQPYLITTDAAALDIEAIHQYLTRSSWAAGISLELVRESISHSLNFGLFDGEQQIGFARVVTDYTTFGYLCDVYVLESHQQQKLGRWLVECCQAHPTLARLRRIMLVTSTAPWLYEKLGYQAVNKENFVWQITRPDIYRE